MDLTDNFEWLSAVDFTAWRVRLRDVQRARRTTALRVLALESLQVLIGTGQDMPTDAKIAAECRVRCSPRTVRRARADAEAAEMLGVERTRQLRGGRWRQGPNRYRLALPGGPVLVCPAGQIGRASKKARKKDSGWGTGAAISGVPAVPAPDLAARAALTQARLAAEYAARWRPG